MSALRDLQHALELTYAGEQSIEAGCVKDHLEDLGWVLTPAPRVKPEQDPLPLASTSGLPKMHSGS